jgi:phage shock protein E
MKSFPIRCIVIGLLCGGLASAEIQPKSEPVKIDQAEKLWIEGTQLLDVRTKEEWDAGHLPGAQRIDIKEDGFLDKAKATLDPKRPVLVYCRSGNRSKKASDLLREAGFSKVYEIEGGIVAWKKAGKPIEK